MKKIIETSVVKIILIEQKKNNTMKLEQRILFEIFQQNEKF